MISVSSAWSNKYVRYSVIALAVVVVAYIAFDLYRRSQIIEENAQRIRENEQTISFLRGQIELVQRERDSLMVLKNQRSNVINNYTRKIENPVYRVETNSDSAYVFLKQFSRTSQ